MPEGNARSRSLTRRIFLRDTAAATAAAVISSRDTPAAAPASPIGAALKVRSVKQSSTGVLLKLSTGVMGIEIYSPRIVRVTYAPSTVLPDKKSLAVISPPASVRWHLSHSATHVIISTSELVATINRNTAAVKFSDVFGAVFLGETVGGGKTMRPKTFNGVGTYEVTQRFDLAEDEAIYGLGQHQQGLVNYRGSQVRLEQRNMHVAIPVMLSSRGYGIFWDNPAITDVSLGANNLEIIASQNLLCDGKPGGLKGEYFDGTNFEKLVGVRIDPEINFTWSGHSPVQGLGQYNYSVRWKGEILPEATGIYQVETISDDGARLWINDKLLIDEWQPQLPTAGLATIRLEAGRKYPVVVEYFQASGGASMQLRWSTPEKSPSIKWRSDVGEMIDYYAMYGPDLDRVVAEYRFLTGSVPMLGRWGFGYWQSRNSYRSQEEILGVAAEYRSMDVPIAGIVQDIGYSSPAPLGSNTFNPLRYPDPVGMITELHGENIRFMISVWPKFQPGSRNFSLLKKAGVLYPSSCGFPFYDPFNPLGRALYWQCLNKDLFSLGVDAWWQDASEPELCGQWGEFANIRTFLGWGAFVYNAYPLMHSSAVYDGQRRTTNTKRVMILSRSAWAGQQRNSALTWSGDVRGDWSTFARQIPAGINFCLGGIPYWTTDIGGYTFSGGPQNPEYQELFTRWFQFGAFCPMFRVHGLSYPKEIWRFGEPTLSILEAFIRLRYRLLPYIYSVAWNVTHNGYTMLRGLVMDFRADSNVREITDQFMFGPAILVCPVTTKGARRRTVYLPRGTHWFDFWTGRTVPGGQNIRADAPIDSLPLFIRAGSIIPMGTVAQNAGPSADDVVELRVYTSENGAFDLYEDQGDGYGYESGAYTTIAFRWDQASNSLTIGKRQGHFPGMRTKRTIHIVFVGSDRGTGIMPSEPDHLVEYVGEAITIRKRK